MWLVLVLSLTANLSALLAALLFIRRRGGVGWLLVRLRLRPAPPTDYAALGRQRFGEEMEPGGTLWWGDSIGQNAPLLRMLADARQWGIGGQTIADLRSWLPQVISAGPDRLVILAGTNDLLLGRDAVDALRDLGDLLADVRAGLPQCDVQVSLVPPLAGRAAQASAFNAGLGALGVPIHPMLTAPPSDWSDDGVHPSRRWYLSAQVFG